MESSDLRSPTAIFKLNQTGMALLAVLAVGLLVIAGVGLVVVTHHPVKLIADPNACVNKSFTAGSGASGPCVRDIQTMVNPQAYGIDGQLYIKVSGNYDAATVSAVKTFQKNVQLAQTGTITPKDWQQLCHTDDASSTFMAAAKDAGCPS